MDDAQRKAQIKKTFDTVAEGYGSRGMQFFHNAAAHLPGVFKPHGDESLLDVAAGTGIASCALAPHLPRGRVTAIDLSDAMLAQARSNAAAKGLANVETRIMDMQDMAFDDGHFDGANCSFGIFFLPDMTGLLKHIASKVKRNGHVVATSFLDASFEPNISLFLERIQHYGVTPPDVTWKAISTREKFHALFAGAGLRDIEVHQHDIGYFLAEAEDWWRVIWYAGFRGLVSQLSEANLARFKNEHLAEISALRTPEGIPLSVGALIASGRV